MATRDSAPMMPMAGGEHQKKVLLNFKKNDKKEINGPKLDINAGYSFVYLSNHILIKRND